MDLRIEDVQGMFKQALRDAFTYLTRSREREWLESDAEGRNRLVRLFAENDMVSKGYVPSSWRYRATCRSCGNVPVEEPVGEELVGCPWCASGSKPEVYTFL